MSERRETTHFKNILNRLAIWFSYGYLFSQTENKNVLLQASIQLQGLETLRVEISSHGFVWGAGQNHHNVLVHCNAPGIYTYY